MMKQVKFKELSATELEAINGGDWLKDVRDYWNGVFDGIKSVFNPNKK
ncbi:bacteriocin [Streptococcus suis]